MSKNRWPFFAIALLILAGCSRQGEPRLSGTFVSDKAATMAYLREVLKNEPKKLKSLERLGKHFGKLKVTYRDGCVVTELDGNIETEKLRIIKSTEAYIITESLLLGDPVKHRLEFCEDGYWVSGGMLELPFKEKFRKVR